MQTRWMGALAAAGVLALAGCGGGNDSGASGGSGGSGGGGGAAAGSGSGSGGGPIALAADPGGALKFDKTQLDAKAGSVTIDFANASSVPHAVEVQGNGVDQKTKVFTGGDATLKLKLEPGTYTFFCPVDGHRQAGMEGTLTVH